MDLHIVLVFLACAVMSAAGWSLPYYPVPSGPHRTPIRMTRFATPPPPGYRLIPVRVADPDDDARWQRAKRNHEDDYGRDDYNRDEDYGKDDDYSHRDDKGVTGPVHTFVKTDKNANYKWGVRHHVGNKFAS